MPLDSFRRNIYDLSVAFKDYNGDGCGALGQGCSWAQIAGWEGRVEPTEDALLGFVGSLVTKAGIFVLSRGCGDITL